ncbi:hypothetical protein SAMN05216218_107138 [Halorientalis regularis]|jgi:hypothetical protein|uniref:Uncharacterized protein n=2 Tax=Halorientalis regularis TaxID=660518 RepID=A0A1G7M5A9_9EURY|nr:hypothetical protein SAMN05216218_107138 [Halorientalis regularis]
MVLSAMLPVQLGPLGSPPALLLGLLALAAVIVVGRLLLRLAWKLVVIALVVVAALWVVGAISLGDVLIAAPY